MEYGTLPLDEFTPAELPDSDTITLIAGTPTIQSEALVHEILSTHDPIVYLTPQEHYPSQILTHSAYFTGEPAAVDITQPDELDPAALADDTPMVIELAHGQLGNDFNSDLISTAMEYIMGNGGPLIIHTDEPLVSAPHRISTGIRQLATMADVIATVEQDTTSQDAPAQFILTKCRHRSPMVAPMGLRFEDQLAVDTTEQF